MSPIQRFARTARSLLEMIKFEHTIFALPFALIAAILAADMLHLPHSLPSGRTVAWIVLAMVGARTAAMTFNRIVDARIDARNPRTASRAIPAGIVTPLQAWVMLGVAVVALAVAAWELNPLCLALCPGALIATCGYSFTKRFTPAAHAVLGAAIGIAPVGAWIAITGHVDLTPLLLAGVVALWIGGFDVIYALLDVEFDRANRVHSLPAALGPRRALWVSRAMHLGAAALLVAVGHFAHMGVVYFAGVALVAGLLVWEHTIVQPDDQSRLNMAFFTINGWVSVCLFAFVVADRVLAR